MAKYTEEFKVEALIYLRNLQEKGLIVIARQDEDIRINNVRELVKFLGISSYTLYQWNAKFIVKEEREESNLLEELSDLNEELNEFVGEPSIKAKTETIKELPFLTMKLGNTYFMDLAKALKIKNYRMPLKQLYLKIGTELIKLSGLVENGVRKELKQ